MVEHDREIQELFDFSDFVDNVRFTINGLVRNMATVECMSFSMS